MRQRCRAGAIALTSGTWRASSNCKPGEERQQVHSVGQSALKPCASTGLDGAVLAFDVDLLKDLRVRIARSHSPVASTQRFIRALEIEPAQVVLLIKSDIVKRRL